MENFRFDIVRRVLKLRVGEVVPERRNDEFSQPELNLGLKKLENLSTKLLRLEAINARVLEVRDGRKRSAFKAEDVSYVLPCVVEVLVVIVHFRISNSTSNFCNTKVNTVRNLW